MGWGSLPSGLFGKNGTVSPTLSQDFTLFSEVTRLTREAKEIRHGPAKLSILDQLVNCGCECGTAAS